MDLLTMNASVRLRRSLFILVLWMRINTHTHTWDDTPGTFICFLRASDTRARWNCADLVCCQSESTLMQGIVPEKHQRRIFDQLIQSGLDLVVKEGEVWHHACVQFIDNFPVGQSSKQIHAASQVLCRSELLCGLMTLWVALGWHMKQSSFRLFLNVLTVDCLMTSLRLILSLLSGNLQTFSSSAILSGCYLLTLVWAGGPCSGCAS